MYYLYLLKSKNKTGRDPNSPIPTAAAVWVLSCRYTRHNVVISNRGRVVFRPENLVHVYMAKQSETPWMTPLSHWTSIG